MSYSVEMLATVEQCDTLLELAQAQKDDLEFSKSSESRDLSNYQDRTVKVEADLMAVSAELEALQTMVDTLPEGDLKQDTQSRIKRLEYRKWLLEMRSETYGVTSLLERELDLAIIDRKIEEVDTLIQAVTDRKATL